MEEKIIFFTFGPPQSEKNDLKTGRVLHFPAACNSDPSFFSLFQFFFTFQPPGQHPSGLAWPGLAWPCLASRRRPGQASQACPSQAQPYVCRSLSSFFSLFQFFSLLAGWAADLPGSWCIWTPLHLDPGVCAPSGPPFLSGSRPISRAA